MKKMICLDLDGTLLKNNGTISKKTIEVINEVEKKGYYIVICTARARNFAINISKKFNNCRYIITSNGAEVYDWVDKKIVYLDGINKEEVKEIWDYCNSYGFKLSMAIDEKEYVNSVFRKNQILIDNYKQLNNNYNSIKQCMIVSDDYIKINKYFNMLKYNKNIKLSSDKISLEECGYWVSVLPILANKGNGIYQLTKKLNIEKDNVISFGNDLNDISMFKNSGLSIAVNNAEKELLKICNETTLSNEEDGVARWLDINILNNEYYN